MILDLIVSITQPVPLILQGCRRARHHQDEGAQQYDDRLSFSHFYFSALTSNVSLLHSKRSTHFWNLLIPSHPNFSKARMASTTVRSDPGRVFE